MSFHILYSDGFATLPENGTVALPSRLFKSYADVALAYEKTAKRHFMEALRMFTRVPARNIWASPGNKMNMLPTWMILTGVKAGYYIACCVLTDVKAVNYIVDST